MREPPGILGADFARTAQQAKRASATMEIPTLIGAGTRSVEAWFLGPKGENAEAFERLIVDAIRDHVHWRRNYHPGDPTHISEEIKTSPEYVRAMGALTDSFRELLAFLKKSVPFFSMRYQGHMNWDLTIPGLLGYFSAMLYNPNNVAFEGSTATTILELLVGDDVCRMLGYSIPTEGEISSGAVRPWGHVTCDGTVANIEALWSARNAKFYPLSLKAALNEESALAKASTIDVATASGRIEVASADAWALLNIASDDILALPARLTREFGIPREAIADALSDHTVQALGLAEFSRRHGIAPPVFFVPGTKHYSFPKAAALLGLGATNMIDVAVDMDARMDLAALESHLERCLGERRAVLTVVCVIGSTEESAVDPIADVLRLREDFRARGLDFTIHADAAWGGYHASVLREDFEMPAPSGFVTPPSLSLSTYVTRQFEALGMADSITVDPHKSGYIPYPAGALCYRNSAMRDLVTFSAPVVYHGDAEPTVGIYGIEGSKPGAAVAAVYLSHRVIRPSKSGYGRIIGQALFSCRKLYARLLCMAKPDDPFIVVPLPRAVAGHVIEQDTIDEIRERIDRPTTEELLADARGRELIAEIGPDQNILAYAFNFRNTDGTLNTDLAACNRLNKALYSRLSIDPGKDIYGYDLIVSTTDLDARHYGPAFIDELKRRLGVADSAGDSVTVLRSVVMDPWVTETSAGSFIDVLEREFRKAVLAAVNDLRGSAARGY
jgi:glutamate/tyrosine decarboxylase-like PLP-dependent enzyme